MTNAKNKVEGRPQNSVTPETSSIRLKFISIPTCQELKDWCFLGMGLRVRRTESLEFIHPWAQPLFFSPLSPHWVYTFLSVAFSSVLLVTFQAQFPLVLRICTSTTASFVDLWALTLPNSTQNTVPSLLSGVLIIRSCCSRRAKSGWCTTPWDCSKCLGRYEWSSPILE